MRRRVGVWTVLVVIAAFLCPACSSSSDDRFSVIKTDQGSYVVDKKTGQSYKYPPEKPVKQ